MSMKFGLYVTVVGVGLVFAALIAVAILSKVLTGIFKEEGNPVGEKGDEGKIAAVAAVIASMVEHPEYGSRTTRKGVSRWETAARMEAMERSDER
jgi:Na+-transporting methylmalonyl-CoA/oxaloacetate decarboxylase gamma subunit